MNLYPIAKSFLFQLDPENAHHLTLSLLKQSWVQPFLPLAGANKMEVPTTAFGLNFKNPVGLAAGLDKNGEVIDGLAALGFGFVEIGTVTPKSQEGNPKPRLFRLPKDEALINRMGFNNVGADQAVRNLASRKSDIIVGGNIGKNKITPNEEAVIDYEICFQKLFGYVDYFVVNVSSPNTPNLRALQDAESLKIILNQLQHHNHKKDKPKPILLKIAPDLTFTQLDEIVEIVSQTKIAGIIATNTTISREGLPSYSAQEVEAIGAGGLSGKPLTEKSHSVISYINKQAKGNFQTVAVGGIMNADDAVKNLQSGSSLVQLYSGFIYKGPQLISDICERL